MGWYDDVKSYVWDDRTTPYLVPVARLSKPQADKELFVYALVLTVLFSGLTVVSLSQARAQQNPILYWPAAHAASIVACAIYLAFGKRVRAAQYAVTAPVALLIGLATGTLNPHLSTREALALGALALLLLLYSLRVIALARAYADLPDQLPTDLPPMPPSPRREP